MTHSSLRLTLACCCWLWACSGSDDKPAAAQIQIASADAAAAPEPHDAATADAAPGPLTYWQDMAPIFEDHCMRCHRDGGIAPFRLDVYAETKPFAQLIEKVTRERSMPPWSVTSDGSCGEFANVEALSDDEIARISQWVQAGAPEGRARAITVPQGPALGDALELKTPDFEPQIQGGELAAFDEYRCFLLDVPSDAGAFITGYEVLPGTPEIVHHALVAIVDPDQPAEHSDPPGLTNIEQIRALDAESPDRDGWSCYGMAGEGVKISAAPVVWAPGQGVITYPNESGIPLDKKNKIVVQLHYNLADSKNVGKRDQTTLRLRTANDVKNVAIFDTEDPFLGTLDGGKPAMLPPAQASTTYSWTATGRELGMGSLDEAQLYGIMPHMHQLGHKYRLTVSQPGQPEQCAADVQSWDFHWQRMYFYDQPLTIRPDTKVSVTCDFDTSSVTYPVKPGWGTRNEMCLAVLFFTVPKSALMH